MSRSANTGLRVAFFGGSFDPPHLGHLAVARAARAALSLDEVLFAPVGAQPLKPAGSTACFEDRVEMTQLAIQADAAFKISLADAPKPGGEPNYTLETLLTVKNELPPDSQLFCLMGADSFAGLQQWFRAAEIPFVAPLIVAARPGQPLHDLKALLPKGLQLEQDIAADFAHLDAATPAIKLRGYTLVNQAGRRAPFYLLPDVDIPISASSIREQIREKEGAQAAGEELLPARVAAYIRSRGLYR